MPSHHRVANVLIRTEHTYVLCTQRWVLLQEFVVIQLAKLNSFCQRRVVLCVPARLAADRLNTTKPAVKTQTGSEPHLRKAIPRLDQSITAGRKESTFYLRAGYAA